MVLISLKKLIIRFSITVKYASSLSPPKSQHGNISPSSSVPNDTNLRLPNRQHSSYTI